MRNKKTFNLALMLSILVLHTFTLSYWLSKESNVKLRKTENSSRLNFKKYKMIPAVGIDSNIKKSLNTSASLRQ